MYALEMTRLIGYTNVKLLQRATPQRQHMNGSIIKQFTQEHAKVLPQRTSTPRALQMQAVALP
jgi:hypothetical protein